MTQTQNRLACLHRSLCTAPNTLLMGIVDAAVDESLYGKLQMEPKQSYVTCLYSGDPAIRYARYAPYLITLHPDSPLTLEWMDKGWDRHWGTFFASAERDDSVLKRHFKRFLSFQFDGKKAWLRFYDPRVLPGLLQGLSPGNCFDFFGGSLIHSFGASQAGGKLWQARAEAKDWVLRSVAAATPKIGISSIN